MADRHPSRREFMQDSAAFAAVAAGIGALGSHVLRAEDLDAIRKTRSYHPDMEYRRLGKTNLWVSAVCLGGHWKRIDKVTRTPEDFDKNRYDIVTRCIEQGINLIDACTGGEVMAYSKALKGRREAMFLNYSWFEKEMRFDGWQTAKKLMQSFDEGLKAANLEYVDLWRITCHERGSLHPDSQADEFASALDTAKKQGKCRFTGISTHDRPWLIKVIQKYPDQIQAICSPYTANSKTLPKDSLFEVVRKQDVGFLGIKPFASNSLFKGDSAPGGEHAEEDDRRARMAIRYILCNPAITAPIPGLITREQVDNVVAAVKERRKLDRQERAEMEQIGQEMWARLPEDYQWLKDWKYV